MYSYVHLGGASAERNEMKKKSGLIRNPPALSTTHVVRRLLNKKKNTAGQDFAWLTELALFKSVRTYDVRIVRA